MLPIAVAIGSHCIQTHISYTVLVTGLLAGVVVWLATCGGAPIDSTTAIPFDGW
jgi:hypothetical protein